MEVVLDGKCYLLENVSYVPADKGDAWTPPSEEDIESSAVWHLVDVCAEPGDQPFQAWMAIDDVDAWWDEHRCAVLALLAEEADEADLERKLESRRLLDL